MPTNGHIAFFVGGAKGVGKSTLLKKISLENRLCLINTGDFFNDKQSKESSKLSIINFLTNIQSPVIVDTHYAGCVDNIFSGKFERGLYKPELEKLSQKIDIQLFLIEVDQITLYNRRINDPKNSRDIILENIRLDIVSNRKYFQEYCSQLNQNGHLILNYDLSKTKIELELIIKKIVNSKKQ